jgi:hypothetical protein
MLLRAVVEREEGDRVSGGLERAGLERKVRFRGGVVRLGRWRLGGWCSDVELGVLRAQEKNVHSDMLEGRVGRIYMPKQKVDSMALSKMKGLRRERRAAAGDRKKAHADGTGPAGPKAKVAKKAPAGPSRRAPAE